MKLIHQVLKQMHENFAVFFPQDAHMGKGAEHAGAQNILKVVVKIAVEQL